MLQRLLNYARAVSESVQWYKSKSTREAAHCLWSWNMLQLHQGIVRRINMQLQHPGFESGQEPLLHVIPVSLRCQSSCRILYCNELRRRFKSRLQITQQIEWPHAVCDVHHCVCVFVTLCDREGDRYGIKKSVQSHSPNLITVEFIFVFQEYKLDFIFSPFFFGK